jgi:flagellar protein FlaG
MVGGARALLLSFLHGGKIMSMDVTRISTKVSGELQQKEAKKAVLQNQNKAREQQKKKVEHRKRPKIEATLAEIERISFILNRKLKFSVNRELNQVVVKVIDGNTDKVIRELPPEELQRLHLRIRETIGILFDEKI